jgi:hypothetical protein
VPVGDRQQTSGDSNERQVRYVAQPHLVTPANLEFLQVRLHDTPAVYLVRLLF